MKGLDILLICFLVSFLVSIFAVMFLFILDIIVSKYRTKKTGEAQYWIVGRGGHRVSSFKSIVLYRLKLILFVVIICLVLYLFIVVRFKQY